MGQYRITVHFSGDDEDGLVATDMAKAIENIAPYMGDNVEIEAAQQVVGGKKGGSWKMIYTNAEDDLAKDAQKARTHRAAEAYNAVMVSLEQIRESVAADYAECAGSEEDFATRAMMVGTALVPIVKSTTEASK